jgi:hypothetical protein
MTMGLDEADHLSDVDPRGYGPGWNAEVRHDGGFDAIPLVPLRDSSCRHHPVPPRDADLDVASARMLAEAIRGGLSRAAEAASRTTTSGLLMVA